jgi:hypothetical protein
MMRLALAGDTMLGRRFPPSGPPREDGDDHRHPFGRFGLAMALRWMTHVACERKLAKDAGSADRQASSGSRRIPV